MRFVAAERFAPQMNEGESVDFLRSERVLMRLAMVDPDGYPMVHPVWFVYEDDLFWIAVERISRKAKLLKENAKVYFTIDTCVPNTKSIEPPRGVRGRGKAVLIEDDSLALKVMQKQLLKYHGCIDDEYAKVLTHDIHRLVVIKIKPIYFATWDYAKSSLHSSQ